MPSRQARWTEHDLGMANPPNFAMAGFRRDERTSDEARGVRHAVLARGLAPVWAACISDFEAERNSRTVRACSND